jgi:type VI secretion system Hcp family effector
MKQYTFSLLLALFALSYSHPTAFHSYVSFKGNKQGQFKGESSKGTRHAKDGWFEVTSFEMGSEAPVDANKSGTARGARPHPPVTIHKELDESSPLLLNAHNTNETFETVIIQTVDDQNKVSKTTTLKNAIISEIKKNGTLESISFTYEQMTTQ